MTKVILDKGNDVQVEEYSTDAKAQQRAQQLAKLHAARVVVDRDGDYYIDASDHEHESVTTANGHGAYCRSCGETLA